jgi:hypothetical protein
MKWLMVITVLVSGLCTTAWAGESGGFDPEQPFKDAFNQRWLQSFLNQAFEALEDQAIGPTSCNSSSIRKESRSRMTM